MTLWEASVDLFASGMLIGNASDECSIADVRKNKLNVRELEFNHFVDKDRVSNCVKSLRSITLV